MCRFNFLTGVLLCNCRYNNMLKVANTLHERRATIEEQVSIEPIVLLRNPWGFPSSLIVCAQVARASSELTAAQADQDWLEAHDKWTTGLTAYGGILLFTEPMSGVAGELHFDQYANGESAQSPY